MFQKNRVNPIYEFHINILDGIFELKYIMNAVINYLSFRMRPTIRCPYVFMSIFLVYLVTSRCPAVTPA